MLPLAPVLGQRASLEKKLSGIKLPAGFKIAVYAADIPGARSLTMSPAGILYVGNRAGDRIYALVDSNHDHRIRSADKEIFTIGSGLEQPNGVAFRDGVLYVSEVVRVLRYPDIESRLSNPPPPEVAVSGLPFQTAHSWRYIGFGPDGKLYVSIGMPCNVCLQADKRFGSIMRMNPDGSGQELYATGIRNSAGFLWHPGTQELWFTDNGRDWLGDNSPPDELNYAPTPGLNFGFPYMDASIPDPEFEAKQPPQLSLQPPVQELGPHVAALGMRFYTGRMFPPEYQGRIFIAEHGSWNRTVPIGYRVTWVRLEGNQATGYEVFAEGWLLKNGKSWGRPVDVLVAPDGALLVSDDQAGAIYRITFGS
jgi:glucose/arabinose dehydrogenase